MDKSNLKKPHIYFSLYWNEWLVDSPTNPSFYNWWHWRKAIEFVKGLNSR